MRNFILAKAYSSDDFTSLAAGSVGFYYLDDSQEDSQIQAANAGDIVREGMLILGRSKEKGGNIVLPIFKHNFTYTKGEYSEATTFKADLTVEAPTLIGCYSVIIVKKGMKFNERNKWTSMIYVRDLTMSASDLAEKIVENINNNTVGSGVTAEASGAKITITAVNAGEDYAVLGADLLTGVTVNESEKGIAAYGDAKYVTDLANKAAADAGFEYTFKDGADYLYPIYPLNPLKADDEEDKGYTIYTLRFSEPRDVVTKDETVNQIIQVAFPTGSDGDFEDICKDLAGITSSSDSDSDSDSEEKN